MLRQSGDVSTLSIGVVGPETPLERAPARRRQRASVDAVADLLCGVLDGLKSEC